MMASPSEKEVKRSKIRDFDGSSYALFEVVNNVLFRTFISEFMFPRSVLVESLALCTCAFLSENIIDYRCEDGCLPVSASCGAISDHDSPSNNETGFNH
jgi:hypothetical protein